jgi:hypothetical protein
MKKRDDLIAMPEKVKTPIEELEVLAKFADSIEFQVLKRVARRYTENLKTQSFTLREEDPQFAIKHTRYVEQAVGMGLLIKAVEAAQKELAVLDKD